MTSVRRSGDTIRIELELGEAEVLVSLASQVLELLGAEPEATSPADSLEALLDASAAPVQAPDNEVLARLLPAAYSDDDAAAEEFRRLTDSELRAGKRAGLTRIVADSLAGGSTADPGDVSVELDSEAAKVWLYALTDVRLAFGTGIGVSEDMDDERESLDRDSQRFAELSVYDWLGYLQETIVLALTGE